MKLLVITQKVDPEDPILGFFEAWIESLSILVDKLTVICLEKKRSYVSDKVRVISLGKEYGGEGGSILKRILYALRFTWFIWRIRDQYDTVFVHMNPEYVLLGGWLWKFMGKKVSLWFAHGHVPFSLKLAEKIVDIIFTSTESGCRLNSHKILVVGQGIDSNKFMPVTSEGNSSAVSELVTVGRISPVKDYDTLIQASFLLKKRGIQFRLKIIGSAVLHTDKRYEQKLIQKINLLEMGSLISFCGALPNFEVVERLRTSDVFVSASHTGSLDKTLVESMAAGLPTVACNVAMKEVLRSLSPEKRDMLIYKQGDAQELANKLQTILNMPRAQKLSLGLCLRDIAVRDHDIDNLSKRIISSLKAHT